MYLGGNLSLIYVHRFSSGARDLIQTRMEYHSSDHHKHYCKHAGDVLCDIQIPSVTFQEA